MDPVPDVQQALGEALAAPIGTAAFSVLCAQKLKKKQDCLATVVVSDNTRPVPYMGSSGIIWPIVERLMQAGLSPMNINILVASGTHRPLTYREIRLMLDERVLQCGVRIHCHDAFDSASLIEVGRTISGINVLMNRIYVNADFKILTGLVESHFMAGTPGGRKSVCPGLLSVESVRQFHGPPVLANPYATDLILDGNPCHQLSLEIARMAPADFIVNVTAREDGAVVGIFAGDMERAHEAASEHARSFVAIPLQEHYDVVVTRRIGRRQPLSSGEGG